jgi:hypothetical protein
MTGARAFDVVRPEVGDRILASVTHAGKDPSLTSYETITLPNGAMVITPEQLRQFGGGDLEYGRKELRRLIAVERDQEVRTGPAVRPKSVRIALPADEEAVFQLVMTDLRENAEIVAPINDAKVRRNIRCAITGEGGVRGIIGIIDGPNKEPVAVGILVPYQWWWSEQYYWHEIINYVHKDHRKSNHINDLIQFERWAGDTFTKNFGYRTFVLFGVLGWKRVRSKIMLYRRKLTMSGAAFLYPYPFDDEVKS